MTKRKMQWKWVAVFAVTTILAIAITLGICISQQEDLCAPGVTYDNFVDISGEFGTTHVATPQGDVIALEGTNYTWVPSPDHQTLVGINENYAFTVMSKHGVHTVNQTVNNYYYDALCVSFYGDAVYFFDNENELTGVNTLWRYDVAKNETVQMDTIAGPMYPGVASPNGKYFAAVDASGETRVVVYLYENGEKIRTWKMDSFVELYHLTDDGTLFFRDVTSDLKGIHGEEVTTYSDVSYGPGVALDHILFNRDGTEIILNLSDGSYYYNVEAKGLQATMTQLKEAGNITLFPMEEDYAKGIQCSSHTLLKGIQEDYYTVLDIASFRDVNLLDTENGQRVKLTEDNSLAYQANSEIMSSGILASSGKYILYTDANGDYFYTDTEDNEGTYHLLWEASKCDVNTVLQVTGQKSIYYQDSELNLRYTNGNKDVCLLSQEKWKATFGFVIEDATDTCYFILDDVLYYARKGGSVKKIADTAKLFPEGKDVITLGADPSAGVYCYGKNRATGQEEIVFYRIYPDGSYHLMESAS